MKVTGYTPPDLSTSKAAQNNTPKTQPDAAQAAASAPADANVAVVVTRSSRTAPREAVNQASDVDTQKVEAMKAAIADGSFTVNPDAIAGKLLTSAQEMLGTQQQ
jgi:negative regulator of flagellin synthesis FlgM